MFPVWPVDPQQRITQGLVRNADPQAPLCPTYVLRICILTRAPGDVYVLSVRGTAMWGTETTPAYR